MIEKSKAILSGIDSVLLNLPVGLAESAQMGTTEHETMADIGNRDRAEPDCLPSEFVLNNPYH